MREREKEGRGWEGRRGGRKPSPLDLTCLGGSRIAGVCLANTC